jgi:hypothetical protein
VDCDEHEGETSKQIADAEPDMFELWLTYHDAPMPVILAIQATIAESMPEVMAKLIAAGAGAYELRSGQKLPDGLREKLFGLDKRG